MSEAELAKMVEFGTYRGVIERTPISDVRSVDLDAAGNTIHVVGRRHATLIVKALNDAGYEIVRRP